jgi:hypothetical protein
MGRGFWFQRSDRRPHRPRFNRQRSTWPALPTTDFADVRLKGVQGDAQRCAFPGALRHLWKDLRRGGLHAFAVESIDPRPQARRWPLPDIVSATGRPGGDAIELDGAAVLRPESDPEVLAEAILARAYVGRIGTEIGGLEWITRPGLGQANPNDQVRSGQYAEVSVDRQLESKCFEVAGEPTSTFFGKTLRSRPLCL